MWVVWCSVYLGGDREGRRGGVGETEQVLLPGRRLPSLAEHPCVSRAHTWHRMPGHIREVATEQVYCLPHLWHELKIRQFSSQFASCQIATRKLEFIPDGSNKETLMEELFSRLGAGRVEGISKRC